MQQPLHTFEGLSKDERKAMSISERAPVGSIGLPRLFKRIRDRAAGLTKPPAHDKPRRQLARSSRDPSVLNRRSDVWRDAVGPGFAVGVSQHVIDLMSGDNSG
jgi:hypothetical protein